LYIFEFIAFKKLTEFLKKSTDGDSVFYSVATLENMWQHCKLVGGLAHGFQSAANVFYLKYGSCITPLK
jgi:hypothetical protein